MKRGDINIRCTNEKIKSAQVKWSECTGGEIK